MNNTTVRILLIHDDTNWHHTFERLFASIEHTHYEFTHCFGSEVGFQHLQQACHDVGIVHYALEGGLGLALVEESTRQEHGIPLVLLISEKDSGEEAIAAGAMDFLHQEDLVALLLDRVIRYAIERKKTDKALKNAHQQLHYLMSNDALTGLANRARFNHQFPLLLEHCCRNKHSLAILFLNLDQFKQVNDTLGHHYGDLLLQQVSKRLKDNLRKIDAIFRFDGDEFIIAVDGTINKTKIEHLALKIIKFLSAPFTLHDHICQISLSIGITIANCDNKPSSEQLIREAGIAMYSAKKNGRNNFQLYHPDFLDEFLQNSQLSIDLQQAQINGELSLCFQPLISFSADKIIGVEALLRWQHPALGKIPPTVFIPLAEKTGLIISIGEWVLREACAQKKIWQERGYGSLLMAVNVSILQLQQPDFVEMVLKIIEETSINPAYLELEISESAITNNFEDCSNKMATLKNHKIRFVIDDFGTGYSNLGYLKHFSFDKIKIDKIFIDEIISSNNEQCIVEAIISMAKKMGLEIVAEGVETLEQVQYLRQHHSDQVQGFYYSEPLTAKACTRFLDNGAGLAIPD